MGNMKNRPLRILLGLNEEKDANFVCQVFQSSTYPVSVKATNSIKELKALLSDFIPDLIILSYFFKDEKGLEILRSNNDNIEYPIIIIGSEGDEKIAVEVIQSGAIDYVVRSNEALTALPKICNRVMQKWELIKERERKLISL